MFYQDPGEQVFVPLILSMRADSAKLLNELASEMEVTLDELFIAIAEDHAISLESPKIANFEEVVIPDRVSTNDLWRALHKK